MKFAADRGRLLFYLTAAIIILERLVIAGIALFPQPPQPFSWTNLLMPLTHIAVVIFLAYTADLLIYWLVILWGIVTSGTFAYNLWDMTKKLSPEQAGQLWTKLGHVSIPLVALSLLHLFCVLIQVTPTVRHYLSKKRQETDVFEETPEEMPVAVSRNDGV